MATPTRPPIAPPLGSLAPSVLPSPASLEPSGEQIVVLYVIIAFAVVIFGFWNVPGVRNCINPLKLFTIGWHELCHITAAILSGGRILKITIDPHVGGATIVEGGWPVFILASGYIGSTLLGALFTLAGWDTLVAKVMSFVLGIGLIMPLALVRDKLTIILTIIYEALLIGFWFVDHGGALRWYCLFVGVMNVLFVIWDVADDRFFHKTNDSDATQFAILYPSTSPHHWAGFWILFQLGVLAAFSVLGIMVFKRSDAEMTAEAATFLPT
ncbi:peptidase M50B-like-domain-containing protein [Mycena capillaripes]|nr:peptidase M50B-like-domain-containing protein [Mycena capillaripes]